MYWPLSELDLLNDPERTQRGRSFVASQTTTIFDNLDNQTFTVVSSLQLSQYNDVVEMETVKTNSLPMGSEYNLYACIVDADVRHNYATLGVHFRESPRKIPSEISRRLRAKSVLAKSKSLDIANRESMMNKVAVEVPTDSYANYDLFRENQLKCKFLLSNTFTRKGYMINIDSK